MTEPPIVSPPWEVEASSGWLSPAEATCPLCGYSLRGLQEPRCPECGYRFDWAEVLDPARRLHPYLFEHHPERNLWSFFRTLIGGLRPRRFWTSLHPTQPSRPGRLILHWALAASLLFISATLPLGGAGFDFVRNQSQKRAAWLNKYKLGVARGTRTAWGLRQYGSWSAFAAHQFPINARLIGKAMLDRSGPIVFVLSMTLMWPWMTFAALMIFQISMRRARIRKIHVLRCVLYSFDGLFWLGSALLAPAALAVAAPWVQWLPLEPIAFALVAAILGVGMTAMIYRLIVAYRLYLRFHAPAATVLTTQLIVFFAMMAVFLQITV